MKLVGSLRTTAQAQTGQQGLIPRLSATCSTAASSPAGCKKRQRDRQAAQNSNSSQDTRTRRVDTAHRNHKDNESCSSLRNLCVQQRKHSHGNRA
jgi:hypothetical protein